MKEKRLLQSCSGLLQRLVPSSTYEKCCPDKFSTQPKYVIKESELRVDGLESIRPRQEIKAIRKLTSCGFFEEGASEVIKNAYNKKFKNTMSKQSNSTSKDVIQHDDDESPSEDEARDEDLEASLSSSSEESDPFDFITVQLKTGDGYYIDM